MQTALTALECQEKNRTTPNFYITPKRPQREPEPSPAHDEARHGIYSKGTRRFGIDSLRAGLACDKHEPNVDMISSI